MSSNNENDEYDSSLNSDNDAPMAPSGPPNPYKTPDRLPNLASIGPRRLKKVQTSANDELIETESTGAGVLHTVHGSHDETKHLIAEKRYVELAREAKGWMVGPMPEEPFLDRFLPYNNDMPSTPDTPTKILSHGALACDLVGNVLQERKPLDATKLSTFESMQFPAKKEEDIYEPLCAGLNTSFEGPFRFVCTPNHQDPVDKMKPDLCLYRNNVVKRFEKIDAKTKNIIYSTDLSECELFCEVKRDDDDDPCTDPPESGKGEDLPVPLWEQEQGKPTKAFIKERANETTQKKLDSAIGQFASYAMAILARQHRTHCFCIGIFGSKARLFRWDRAGVVISRAFSYKEKPWLGEFARRYCQATDTQRGHDASVCKATADEEMKFKEKIGEHVANLYGLKDGEAFDELMKKHYEEKKVFKVRVWPQRPKKLDVPRDINEQKVTNQTDEPDDDIDIMEKYGDPQPPKEDFDDIEEAKLALKRIGLTQAAADGSENSMNKVRDSACRQHVEAGQFQYFLVSRPVTVPHSVAGRATRGYWAVRIPDEKAGDKLDDYRICFLKDTWRMDTRSMEREGDIVVELFEAGVDYISDILCHSDVGVSEDELLSESNHETKTNEYSTETWNFNNIGYTSGKHIHYRMVSTEVGCLLRELLGAYELFEATRMAFIAVLQALVMCKRLHGDISVNNILITRKNGEFVAGVLIDWEFSCILNGEDGHKYKRSGTWAYMSINILRNPTDHIRGIRDEMESLFYVVFYCGIRWLPHNEIPKLGETMNKYFYDHTDGKETTGGDPKIANIDDGKFTRQFKWDDKATRLWMVGAWTLQHKKKGNPKLWSPEQLMRVWMDALQLNPSKTNRYEHEIPFRGKNITSAVFPATTSYISWPISYLSREMHASLVLTNPPASRSLKRSFEDALRESDRPITEEERARTRESVARTDHMCVSSKKLRPDTPAEPVLVFEDNVFLESS